MRICVFCGSSPGDREAYRCGAGAFGEALADAGIGLVYGGASVGLMGAVADAALARGGEVIGVIPKSLFKREIAHRGLSKLHVVETMHARKALMAELSDAFVALPGGIGTLEELFEIWTWAQLGHHRKACALLNIDGFYDGLAAFLDHIVTEGFLKPLHRDMLIVSGNVSDLLATIRSYRPPETEKWISDDQT